METFDVSKADLATLAATSDDARIAVLKATFLAHYGKAPEQTAVAGGRANLIGEHVDYPDVQFAGRPEGTPVVHLYSMGGAIQNNYLVAAGKRDDGNVVVAHIQTGERFTVALADIPKLEAAAVAERDASVPMGKRSTPVWAFHTLGAVQEMINRGTTPAGGLNLLLTSNVPHGAGMSNSAANCVALGLVFNALYPTLAISKTIDLVTFARSSENSKFAGGQCGWLDQLLIANSKEGQLTKIDYADNGIQHFSSKLPAHMQFVAFNTNVPHVLAESDYGHRVKELTVGIQFLSKVLGGNVGGPNLKLGTLNALIAACDSSVGAVTVPAALQSFSIVQGEDACEYDEATIAKVVAAVESNAYTIPSELPLHKGKTAKQSFASVLRRMRHQKMSALLVPLAGEAASKGDAGLFGLLLDLEGQSLRMSGDFMITGDNGAQDAMLDAALAEGKAASLQVHGRMLGGGGGGNVLLFADTSNEGKYKAWEAATVSKYNAWAERTYPGQGIKATIITPSLAAGARLL